MVERILVGRIATLAGATGLAEVEAIAIERGMVVASGDRVDIESLAGPRTEHWRLPSGTCVVPGITDAHLHLGMASLAAAGVRLGGLPGRPAVWAAIAEAHEVRVAGGDTDGWLLGDGWSLDQLGEWPTAAELERLAPSRPVALWSHDHHARWASPAALERARIGPGASVPPGTPLDLVRRDASGEPTGVLHEAAATLLDRVIPAVTAAARTAALERYAGSLAVLGVTGVHDPGDLAVSPAMHGLELYRSLAATGRLPLRVTASVREAQLDPAIDAGMRTGRGEGRWREGWLKLFADGSLGSRSAALLQPYESDDPGGPPVGGPAGMVTHDPEAMLAVATRAASHGISVQIHGIGDAAVRAALDVLERIPRVAGVMHRVEHAQLVDAADVPRFAATGIAASVQPCHLCSDAPAVRLAWGSRSGSAFPIGALARSGAVISFGTDAPVESPDPWRNLGAAVSRSDPGWPTDRRPFHPQQAIDLARALRAACVLALTLGDPHLGRLLPGSPADLLVIPADGLADPGIAASTSRRPDPSPPSSTVRSCIAMPPSTRSRRVGLTTRVRVLNG